MNISVKAQVSSVAQSGMTFLDIDIGARAAGMGGCFVCVDEDANSLFWNPAGIAQIKDFDFVINETAWFADMKEYSLGLAYSLGKYGAVGLCFLIMDNPDVHVTTLSYVGGVESWQDEGFQDIIDQYALGIAYARQITNFFSVGGLVKWVHEDFGVFDYDDREEKEEVNGVERAKRVTGWEAKQNIIAYEFGTQYYTGFKDLRIGFSIRNFAPRTRYQLDYFELPLNFKLGMAMDIFSVLMSEDKIHSLTLNIDAIHPRDFNERIQLGSEYWFKDLIALRAGYKFNNDLESFACGVGFKKDFGSFTIKLDYAYSVFGGIFNDIHRISFGISR